MKVTISQMYDEKLEISYTNEQKHKIKALYNIGRNRKSCNTDIELFANDLEIGDDIIAITKKGFVIDTFNSLLKEGKNLKIKCKYHTFFARDLGYTVFNNEKDLLDRVNFLEARLNKKLIKKHEFDWRKTSKLESKAKKHFYKYIDCLEKLEKKFPIEGFFWSMDPNDGEILPQKEYISENDTSYERQCNCKNGNHTVVKIKKDVYWCQNCGTLITGNYKGSTSARHKYNKKDLEDVEYLYPISQHFLGSS